MSLSMDVLRYMILPKRTEIIKKEARVKIVKECEQLEKEYDDLCDDDEYYYTYLSHNLEGHLLKPSSYYLRQKEYHNETKLKMKECENKMMELKIKSDKLIMLE